MKNLLLTAFYNIYKVHPDSITYKVWVFYPWVSNKLPTLDPVKTKWCLFHEFSGNDQLLNEGRYDALKTLKQMWWYRDSVTN